MRPARDRSQSGSQRASQTVHYIRVKDVSPVSKRVSQGLIAALPMCPLHVVTCRDTALTYTCLRSISTERALHCKYPATAPHMSIRSLLGRGREVKHQGQLRAAPRRTPAIPRTSVPFPDALEQRVLDDPQQPCLPHPWAGAVQHRLQTLPSPSGKTFVFRRAMGGPPLRVEAPAGAVW